MRSSPILCHRLAITRFRRGIRNGRRRAITRRQAIRRHRRSPTAMDLRHRVGHLPDMAATPAAARFSPTILIAKARAIRRRAIIRRLAHRSVPPRSKGCRRTNSPNKGHAMDPPPQFQRQLVDYPTTEPAGTIVIDTPHTFLYLMLGNGKALRYGIGVGREGFTWSGTERISRMTEWPDWHPPKEMIERQPYLPRFMAGGETNPLGARALYLGNTLYRIHGTNQPSTIGHFVSSGCIRLTNEDVADLYSRVYLGTRVVVLPGADATAAQRAVAR